jgi:hypothetical protein
LFQNIDGYEQLLTGAHRKPAPIARPPLLVWHLGFWSDSASTKDNERAKNLAAKNRKERKKIVDQYLQRLYKKLYTDPEKGSATTGVSEFGITNATPDYAPLFQCALNSSGDFKDLDPTGKRSGKDSQVVTYRFFWWGLLVQFRFEFHTEYLTLSAYIDMSTHLDLAQFEKSPAPVYSLYSELKKLEINITDDRPTIEDPERHNSGIRKKYETINEALYFAIWEELYKTVLHTDDKEIKALGRVFADFRCLMLSKQADDKYATVQGNRWTNFQQPFWRRRGGASPQDNDIPHNTEKYWQQRRAEFWPLLTVNIRDVDFALYEFTVSQMLKGRAMYVTALGPQPPTEIDGRRFPLCYFVYTYTLNGWQIGRLVDRINSLGTVRLAALIQLEQLREAALKLSDCERNIKSAFVSAHQIKARSKTRKSAQNSNHADNEQTLSHEKQEEVEHEITTLQGHLKDVEETIGDINGMFGGDVEYRIERSRYYVRQFLRGLGALRIRRLEGFQPYNVFVARRLGAAFDSIDLLGLRYQRVRGDIAALFQLYLAHETRAVEIATRDQNLEIERIQSIADIALFWVLLPYYSGNLIDHIFWHDSHASEKMWISVVAFFALIWAWRTRHRIRNFLKRHITSLGEKMTMRVGRSQADDPDAGDDSVNKRVLPSH